MSRERVGFLTMIVLLGPGTLVRAQGGGGFRMPPSITSAIAVGDVDGDGDRDALLGGPSEQVRLYLNGGSGYFSDVTVARLPAVWGPYALALADVDGDSDSDALIANDRLLLNDGSGYFSDVTATHLPPVLDDTRALAVADVDGDGDRDVLVGNQGQNRLYLNDGAGHYSDVTPTHLPLYSEHTWSVALEDVDGDGDRDVLIGNGAVQGCFPCIGGSCTYTAEPNRLYLNDGAGHFTDVTATHMPANSERTVSVALGDVDGDGDRDAVIGNTWGLLIISCGGFQGTRGPLAQNRLYLNDGAGHFTDVTITHWPTQLDATSSVALGDVDGDDDFDALVGNGGHNRLYLNDGFGVFTDVTSTHLPAYWHRTTCLALEDVDGDGIRDALTGHVALPIRPRDRLYLNDGSGVFTQVTETHMPAAR